MLFSLRVTSPREDVPVTGTGTLHASNTNTTQNISCVDGKFGVDWLNLEAF
jgi:hypothetical protein